MAEPPAPTALLCQQYHCTAARTPLLFWRVASLHARTCVHARTQAHRRTCIYSWKHSSKPDMHAVRSFKLTYKIHPQAIQNGIEHKRLATPARIFNEIRKSSLNILAGVLPHPPGYSMRKVLPVCASLLRDARIVSKT
eukprot:359947-Chlamydomonas_euryale.AAC.1